MKKIVLAYSGGLDTSCAVQWLKDKGYEVICFIADLGQGEDFEAIEKRALVGGASKVYIKDLRQEFVEDFIFPSLKSGCRIRRQISPGYRAGPAFNCQVSG